MQEVKKNPKRYNYLFIFNWLKINSKRDTLVTGSQE